MPIGSIPQTIATAFLLRRPPQIGTLVLDCSISETHTMEVDVTEHPVEQGSPVTDHARPKPVTLSINGIVSNTPLSKAQRLQQVQSLGIVFQTTTDAEQVLGQPGYGENAYMALQQMRAQLITVTTSLRTYTNMLMTSLVVPRNKDIGESFQFTALFKEVRFVQNQLTAAKKTVAPKKVSTGKQTPGKATKAVKGSSILYDQTYGNNGISGFFNRLTAGAMTPPGGP